MICHMICHIRSVTHDLSHTICHTRSVTHTHTTLSHTTELLVVSQTSPMPHSFGTLRAFALKGLFGKKLVPSNCGNGCKHATRNHMQHQNETAKEKNFEVPPHPYPVPSKFFQIPLYRNLNKLLRTAQHGRTAQLGFS